jgi:Fe-S oxidoreductase
MVEKLADDVKSGKLRLKKKFGKITYHDPCHLGRLGGVFDAPRLILSNAGELVEMRHNRFESQCCGAGGGVRAAYPKVAEKIAKKRIQEAKDSGAGLLVTACPFCEGMLKSVGGIDVKDIAEIVEECRA